MSSEDVWGTVYARQRGELPEQLEAWTEIERLRSTLERIRDGYPEPQELARLALMINPSR